MPAKKAVKKTTNKATTNEVSPTLSGSAILFGGAAVILLGLMQSADNLQLLLVGFGAALLVLGGALLGMATRPAKKR